MNYQDRFIAYCKFYRQDPAMMAAMDNSNIPFMKWISYQSAAFESVTGLKVNANQDTFTNYLFNLSI